MRQSARGHRHRQLARSGHFPSARFSGWPSPMFALATTTASDLQSPYELSPASASVLPEQLRERVIKQHAQNLAYVGLASEAVPADAATRSATSLIRPSHPFGKGTPCCSALFRLTTLLSDSVTRPSSTMSHINSNRIRSARAGIRQRCGSRSQSASRGQSLGSWRSSPTSVQ